MLSSLFRAIIHFCGTILYIILLDNARSPWWQLITFLLLGYTRIIVLLPLGLRSCKRIDLPLVRRLRKLVLLTPRICVCLA